MNEPSFSSGNVTQMIRRALNLVDPQLIDHGMRVAFIVDTMLNFENTVSPSDREDAHFLALFHDIGAYQTEEIERMVAFETESVWEHAVYGYLLLRELSPFVRLSKVVLYHHMPYERFVDEDPLIIHLAQVLQVADRIDLLMIMKPGISADRIISSLQRQRGKLFSPKIIDLFIEANENLHLVDKLDCGLDFNALAAVNASPNIKPLDFLQLLVTAVDFRSHHTVNHTLMTAWIGYLLACATELDSRQCDQVYYGAFLHDLGKIGIPVEILEKPDRLTAEEMVVMRAHVTLTESIIEGCTDEGTARIALRHHEKLDGSGYPRGLMGDALNQSERILAVADLASALAGARSYKKPYSKEQVLAIINEQAAHGLIDREIVALLNREYDSLMAEVERRGEPARVAYARIQAEYAILLAELS